ncbi:MAG: vitamin K epoxide reductase family protein [bacterium]|nr:vitamin K epoxide reductase family protein [bacterium]
MMNSEPSLQLPSANRFLRLLPASLIVLALIGFGDALYLTISAFEGVIPVCTIGGCEQVLGSSYAKVGGMPVALFGALYYGAVFGLLVWFVETKSRRACTFALILVSLATLATLYFIYLQAFVIEAWCLYCLLSAAVTFALLAGLILLHSNKTVWNQTPLAGK